MDEVKCASILKTGADTVVSNDSSCLMQIRGMLEQEKSSVRSLHLAEILASK
jgi:L-lactate dehydrogenase complex protein LldE